MNRVRFRLIRGFSTVLSCALLLAACNYGFQGGGGFPEDIRTIYIEPFENQTVQAELDQLLFQRLTDLPTARGARPGSQTNADAVVRGKIVRYDNVGQNYAPGQQPGSAVQILTQQVTITVAVEIVDRKRNVILWDSQALVGRGEWRQDSQLETDGRTVALKHILQQIIDGAQSQW
ncbi:MAG: LPS assembly lipoprotein LptE [Gemmatimonadota bacterium]